MTERPILFSATMVRAILEGRKTQTRRVVKPQPSDNTSHYLNGIEREWDRYWPCSRARQDYTGDAVRCPYGVHGDRLWVRERHCFLDVSKSAMSKFEGTRPHWNVTIEWSDGTERDTRIEGKKPKQTRERGGFAWRPSIHMPRWACRLVLEVTAVRVERLQEISPSDAECEGVEIGHSDDHLSHRNCFVEAYERLWNSLNAKRGFGWEVNPWVWVIEFKRRT